MPRLIRLNMLDLASSIDARTDAGVALAEADMNSVAGEKFTAQQRLDIYNQARIAYLSNYARVQGVEGLFLQGGVIKPPVTGSIALVSGTYGFEKPSDYITLISLYDSTKTSQIIILPPTMYADSLAGRNADILENSAIKQIYMFALGTRISNSDATLNADSYTLIYIGCTLWTLANLDASTQETIEDNNWPIVKELAIRIANQWGNAEVDALALTLLGGKR